MFDVCRKNSTTATTRRQRTVSALLLLPAAYGAKRRLPSKCLTLGTEPITNELLGGIFDEAVIPHNASVVDAGSHIGQWSFHFASNHTRALVHAIDPSRKNTGGLRLYQRLCGVRNLRPLRGGLGAAHGTFDFASFVGGDTVDGVGVQISFATTPPQPLNKRTTSSRRRAKSDNFTVYTIDELFMMRWPGETLGFAHLDVEGSELSVLHGAVATIARDRPLLMTEVHVHRNRSLAVAVIAQAERYGYQSWLVDEACGQRQDCRNVLHVPHSRVRQFVASTTVATARAKRNLLLVDKFSIVQMANPCCAPWASCCPQPADTGNCCTRAAIRRHEEESQRRGSWLGWLRGR